jgi:hypothetical protein
MSTEFTDRQILLYPTIDRSLYQLFKKSSPKS